jgi:hypothetical protein
MSAPAKAGERISRNRLIILDPPSSVCDFPNAQGESIE